jgi:hypothetical protein
MTPYQGFGPHFTSHGGAFHNMLRTANLTREDFSIEELHCQVVFKIQRQKQVLRDIEMMPAEREQEECCFYMMEESSTEMYASGKK